MPSQHDSGSDDFGGFGATTPKIPRTAPTNSKPGSSRVQAGPSRSAGGPKNSRKGPTIDMEEESEVEIQEPAPKKTKIARGRKLQEENDPVAEDEGSNDDQDDGGEEVEEVRAPPKARGGSRKPTSRSGGAASAVNGVGKGKAKAKPSVRTTSSKVQAQEEPMDVDALDDQVEMAHVEAEVAGPSRTNMKDNKISAKEKHNGKASYRPPPRRDEAQEVVRLEEQLSQARAHIDDLKRQLDELYQVRLTEPEQLLERMEAQHQIQTQAHDTLVQDLTTRLARHDPIRKGKTAVFELLTREEADKETQKLQQQLKTYKEAIQERDHTIKKKDQEIESLRQDQRALQVELKAEIDRGKTLVDKAQRQPPGSASRSHNNGPMIPVNQDPKMTQIIRFYEDLSNIIIPNMKRVAGRHCDSDEWQLGCCYTHTDVTDKSSIPKSLFFTLRLCWDPKSDVLERGEPITNMDQLVESVHYLPKELDKESPEFVESLGFLKDNFTFERDQLSLFVRTLHDYVSGEGPDEASKRGNGADSDDDSVISIE